MKDLRSKLKLIPKRPGVYLFKDKEKKVIYVGKAKSLKKRVSSYFSKTPDTKKTELLLRDIKDVEYIVSDSELEALILENNMIKKHRPRYNIVLRDDKQYPYLKLTFGEEWPRLIIVRKIEDDGARYFGPMSGGAAREMLKLVKRLFPIRWCRETPLRKRKQPCMYYHIGRCVGPCIEPVSKKEYMKLCGEIAALLQGKIEVTVEEIRREMEEASRELQFEKAKVLRDRMIKLKKMERGQRVVCHDRKDRDVFAISRIGERACAVVFHVREGKLVHRDFFFPQEFFHQSEEDVLDQAAAQYYSDAAFIPDEIILAGKVAGIGLIKKLIAQRAGRAVKVISGEKYPLSKMAKDNARLLLERRIISHSKGDLRIIEELKKKLKLPVLPVRIEAFDVSNISGTSIVGSMATFVGGYPYKRDYRRFEVKGQKKPDDVAAMFEIVKRRYSGSLRVQLGFPDLVLVDGGIGQVRAGKRGLNEAKISNIPIISLAKKHEEVYVPSSSKPLKLGRDSRALKLLQRIRDEAHRFAVSYHRLKRKKRSGGSALDEIPGIGKLLKRKLLAEFKDVKAIKSASLRELSEIKGISPSLAKRILKELSF